MKKPPRSWLWLQGLACGAIACLATPTAVLMAVLLAPGWLVWLLEREAGHPNGRAMLLCGLAFGFPTLDDLWTRGHTIAVSMALIQDPGVLAWAWAGCCLGWLVREGVWLVARLSVELIDHRKMSALRLERARLQAEWGDAKP